MKAIGKRVVVERMRGLSFGMMIVLLAACDQKGRVELGEAQEIDWLMAYREQWQVIDYGNPLMVEWLEDGVNFGAGQEIVGLRWVGEKLPLVPYEVSLEARRVSGGDFFCGLTVPVRGVEECATLIVGGWGGGLVGLSSIDGLDASKNVTASHHAFEEGRWYDIRLRVEADKVSAWLDGEELFAESITGKVLALRPGPIELCAPLGLASYQTTAEIRRFKVAEFVPGQLEKGQKIPMH